MAGTVFGKEGALAVRTVLMIGNALLRRRSAEVDFKTDDVMPCLHDLRDTLRHLQRIHGMGRALAAPQIGVHKRIVYMEPMEAAGKPIVMINPRITARSAETFPVWDSCYSADLSFFGKTERHSSITVEYFDEKQNRIRADFTDGLSELFQHEIDHLEGILFTDRIVDNRIVMRGEWEKLQ
jgi:peptide deformylase